MEKTASKIKRLITSEAANRMLKIILAVFIIDLAVAVFGGAYLSANVGTFYLKSMGTILSDFLFYEGTGAFAVGAIIAFFTTGASTNRPKDEEGNAEQPRKKRIRSSILLIIAGTCLIILSITVGTISIALGF